MCDVLSEFEPSHVPEVLQLGLTIALDSPMHGKRIYKLVMLKLLSKMCTFFTNHSHASMSRDTVETAVKIIEKVTRRIDKLTNCVEISVSTESIIDVLAAGRAEASECLPNVRRFLDEIHKEMMQHHEDKGELSMDGLELCNQDVVHDLSSLKKYLEGKNSDPTKGKQTENAVEMPKIFTFDAAKAPDVDEIMNQTTVYDLAKCLHGIEEWVLTYLNETNVQYLRSAHSGSTILCESQPVLS